LAKNSQKLAPIRPPPLASEAAKLRNHSLAAHKKAHALSQQCVLPYCVARMQSEPLSGGSGLDPGNEASLSSCSVDDEISHAPSNNNYSTISIVDHSELHDNDDNESPPAGVEAGREICLGLEASGGGTSGDIIKREGGADYLCPSDDHRLIPIGRLIAHQCIKDGMAMYMLFDIKIVGKVAGIIQISAEIFRVKIAAGANVGKDCIKEVQYSPAIFNSYVRPWTDMWEQQCIDVHQLTPDDERITSADCIETVWQRFNSWF
jgi:hypothetical protein